MGRCFHSHLRAPSLLLKLTAFITMEVESYEQILYYCGDSGRWQVRNFLILFLAGFPEALQTFLHIYLAAVPDHWCHLRPCEPFSYEYIKNISISRKEQNGQLALAKCSRNEFAEYVNSHGSCLHPTRLTNRTVECTTFDFDHSVFESTITTEWNLVCSHEFWRTTSQAVYYAGNMVGSLLFGFMSDSYGRKRAIVHSCILVILFGAAAAFAFDFLTFLVARFFVAVGTAGLFGIPNVLILENVATSRREIYGILFYIPYTLGIAGTAVFGYFIRQWRVLQLATLTPMVMYMFLVMVLVEESPRWLVSQGKVKEAEEGLRRIAQRNRRSKRLPSNLSELLGKLTAKERQLADDQQQRSLKSACVDLFRTPQMRRRMLALSFCWFALTLIYSCGAFNAVNLSADLFLYTFVSGLIEIPANMLTIPLIKFWGRKPTFFSTFLITAVTLIVSLLFPQGSFGMTALAWVGMFCMSGAYSLVYAYGAELMPTCVRSYGMGVADSIGVAGSIGGIYLSGLLSGTLPLIAMAAFALLAGLVALMLPETNGKKLPDTIEDVENENGSSA